MNEQSSSDSELSPQGLRDLVEFAQGLDLSDPEAACASLEGRFPFSGERITGLGAALCDAKEAGEICQHGTDDLRYSRLFKASEDSRDMSADAVWMRVAGPHHTPPAGRDRPVLRHRRSPPVRRQASWLDRLSPWFVSSTHGERGGHDDLVSLTGWGDLLHSCLK
jgi:hypothetical protein